jgi:hypothetical protein
MRILDFDIENRPLNYIAQGYTGDEPTVIACAWVDQPKDVYCFSLSDLMRPKHMLNAFLYFYNKADMVTGHFIRAHDLPIINGALLENGMPPLQDKLTQDTKLDLIGFRGLSKSQKNLAAMLGVGMEKKDMDQSEWRSANRLLPEGINLARERCVSDVKQHMELRTKLLAAGMLKPPRMWRGTSVVREVYTP